ncbi:MAG: transposase [Thermodesulfobacteriota bacterium]
MGFYEYRHLTSEQREMVVRFRQQQGYPWHAPPHPVQGANYYMLTAANFEHSRIMATEERRLKFQQLLLNAFQNAGAEIVAWVVLPNHYHLLIWLHDFGEASSIFKHLHGMTSRQWNLEDETVGRKVWYRYSDRLIRSERHFYASINYTHYNPVKHGWVKRIDEWVCSSFWAYVETKGRDWLVDIWRRYPVKDYGKGWDW